MLVQQPEEHQQRSAATTTSSTTAVSASGLIGSAHCPHASTRHHYLQLPAATTTTTTSTSISASTTGIPSTSASSVTRASTPGPHIYDISSINNMYGCVGGQSLGIGGHRHHFDINQLNREHLRDLPRGSLRRWAILCDTGAVTSVAPRNFADHVPLQPRYTQLSLSTATNQPIHIYGYKDVLLVCNSISFPVRFYICDVKAPLLGERHGLAHQWQGQLFG